MVALAHYSDRDRLYSALISTDVPALVNFSNDATWPADALADQIDAALAWGPPSALPLVGSR